MSLRDQFRDEPVITSCLCALLLIVLMSGCEIRCNVRSAKAAPIRVASYASQRSSGAPLVVMPPAINAGAVCCSPRCHAEVGNEWPAPHTFTEER